MHYDEEFKQHLQRLGYSQGSQQMLPSCVREFLDYTGHHPLHTITAEEIRSYYEYLQIRPNRRRAGGLSSRMIHHHVYALRLFFEYLEQSQELSINPMSTLRFAKPESQVREILTKAEIQSLYEACSTLREKAFLHLFYGCGLRRSEGLKINIKDIHLRSRILYVREGKGSKRRAVPMTERITEDLKNYYHHERGQYLKGEQESEAFLLNKAGRRMKGSSAMLLLKQLLDRAGISKAISLHSLRHSIATHLLETGMSLEYVRDFLGHRHLETTQIYTRVNNHQLKSLC